MVQVGLNMGPRHAQVVGWAVSHTKNLSPYERIVRDGDVIGGGALLWAMQQHELPVEVNRPINRALDKHWVRNLATRDIPEGETAIIRIKGPQYSCLGTAQVSATLLS